MIGELFFPAILIAVGALLVFAAIKDYQSFEIPDWISIAVAVLFVIYVGARNLIYPEYGTVDWLSALAVSALVLVVFAFLFFRDMIGGGDVKMITALSLWAGWSKLLNLLFWISAAGGVVALIWLLRKKFSRSKNEGEKKNLRKAEIPYGIAIAFGGILTGFQLVSVSGFSIP